MQITRHEDGTYTVTETFPEKEKIAGTRQPFENRFQTQTLSARLSDTEDLTSPCEIHCRKAGNGTFIYANNPEMLAAEDVGQLLMKNEGLTGRCFFTYEHSNHTGAPFFIGYQLRNEEDHPVRVTVTNIGNQVRGEWLGQREWSDFYSLRFDLPADYFLEDGRTVNPIYVGCDYVDYTPQAYVPEVFDVPAGGYLWVIGGTSGDLPFGSLHGKTADQPLLHGRCGNGAVLFTIEGGRMTGMEWCYTDPAQCDPSKPEQGYIVKRGDRVYAEQYKGVDPDAAGLTETEVGWVVNDATKAGRLPVRYTVRRDPDHSSVTEPYAPLHMQEFIVGSDHWLTSLNPNDNPTAVGTDMMVFHCVTTDGKEVCIDNEHTDGIGRKANTGNWMMQNTVNYSLVNAGDRDRTFRVFYRNTGVLAVIVRAESGEVKEQKLILQPYNFDHPDHAFAGVDKSLLSEKNGRWWFRVADGRPYCDVWDERSLAYTVVVPAHSSVRFTMDDLILANSCGGVNRWVEID